MTNSTLRRPLEELTETYGEVAVAKQVELEDQMVSIGRRQARKEIENARRRGDESGTRYGQSLLGLSLKGVSDAIVAFIEKASSGAPGKRHIAVKYLKDVDPDVAAYIALRVVIDGLVGKRQVLQRTAVIIGSRLEDEARFGQFEDEDKVMFGRAQQKAKRSTTYERKKATMAGYERRFTEAEWYKWPEQDRLHIGAALIDMIVAQGLVQVEDEISTRRNTAKILTPTERLVDWIEREATKTELLSPAYMPMVVQPLDWTTPFNGGYLTREAQGRNPLVKTRNANYLTEMADRVDDMPMVYDSLNALQRTAWRINRPVFDTMSELWERGNATAGLPQREDITHVSCPSCGQSLPIADMNARSNAEPHACFGHEEVLRKWKQDAYRTHNRNVSLRSKRLSLEKSLKVARMFVEEAAIYFPYQLDFRGRIYCIPSFNPQGHDQVKGLLHFSEGKAIEDGVAAGWLAIQGANVWGFDKASLEDRIGWVEENQDHILATAADPMSTTWWLDADKPFQFLAFCFEWAGFVAQGYGYVSHLPVALDGSCSGIQHFSAMLKDPIGGAAVNLVPADKPQDIYQAVCDKVVEKLMEITTNQLSSTIAEASSPSSSKVKKEAEALNYSLSDFELAEGWLKLEPNRSTTKRQVMTLPYGSTIFSCREYTEAWMKDAIAKHGSPWPQEVNFQASVFMADIIWSSISEVVVAARAAMGWLQACAKELAAEALPVYWQTPVGFPVMQYYVNTTRRRVKTKIGDTFIKLTLSQPTDTIDKRRMQNAISPNVVHSLDATHLVMSVCYAYNNNINSFAMIHDSFGTHASDTEMLAACLREAFVDMYEETDVLGDLRAQFQRQVAVSNEENIPQVPNKGTLDVADVRRSDFFFA